MKTYEIINQKQSQISSLMSQLGSSASNIGDWKIIKCYEAKMKGEELPYDLDDIMARRQEIRDQINAIQDELPALEAQAKAESEAERDLYYADIHAGNCTLCHTKLRSDGYCQNTSCAAYIETRDHDLEVERERARQEEEAAYENMMNEH